MTRDWRLQLRVQASRLVKRRALGRPVVLNFDTNWSLVDGLSPAANAYYCVDPVVPRPGIEDDESITCKKADVLFAISEAYAGHLRSLCADKSPLVLPHSYAFEDARSLDEDPEYHAPPELASLPRPVLGFVGSIHDSYVDIAAVEALSEGIAEGTIVLIGPYERNPLGDSASPELLARLRALPNVRMLGPRPFKIVPRYVKAFDVCLVLTNLRTVKPELRTANRTLFKWLSYLSLGKPIVAPELTEADPIRDIVYLCRTPDEYVAAVRRALSESPGLRQQRIAYASQFTFDKALNLLAAGLQPVVARRRESA